MSEKQYVLNMIDKFAKPGAIFAMVADSYNVYEFCKLVGEDSEIKERIDAHGATGGFVVIRPDSGNPSEVVVNCLRILDKYFGSTVNAKGYKVLNNVRIIQGDGIDHASIRSILFCMDLEQFSADNVAFGQGGALLQMVNRDTLKFAMKCSSIGVREANGELVWRDVYKDPITDSGKTSLRGKVDLCINEAGEYYNALEGQGNSVLQVVYENGELKNVITFDQVRDNSNK